MLRAFAFACLDFDADADDQLLTDWFAADDAQRCASIKESALAARHLAQFTAAAAGDDSPLRGVAAVSAATGHLRCLRWAHEHGCPWGDRVCEGAAYAGHLACLRYAHEHGCPWGSSICCHAANAGHLDCLVYAIDHGCPCDRVDAATEAGANGHLACLAYLHEKQGVALDKYTASNSGNLACLAYAHERGCPWDSDTCYLAARFGRLDCLTYAHEHGCPWKVDACSGAAEDGQLACLQYLHEHGCAWDEDTCTQAARYGQLACLQYAHEHGCAWDEDTCTQAAQYGQVDCLQYAHEHGCPWKVDACVDAAKYSHRLAHRYLCNGQPQWQKKTGRDGELDCLWYLQHNNSARRKRKQHAGTPRSTRINLFIRARELRGKSILFDPLAGKKKKN